MEKFNHESHHVKRLRRSRTNRMLAGVCGGIGAYFDVDPVLVRVVFAVVGLFQGFGLLLYIALAIIVPREHGEIPVDDPESRVRKFASKVEQRADALGEELQAGDGRLRRVFMWLVIILAAAAFIGFLSPRGWSMRGGWYQLGGHSGWGIFMPLLLVVVGIHLIIRCPRK